VPPEKLSQYDFVRAVKETAKNDARVAAEMEKAAAASMKDLPVYKDYGDGMKWVELKLPEKLTEEQAKGVRDFSIKEFLAEEKAVGNSLPYNLMRFVAVDEKGKPIVNQYTGEKAFGETPERAYLAGRLAEEGNQMGHCVGGYCEGVAAGESRIYSLRDAKGKSHVTVETAPTSDRAGQWLDTLSPEARAATSALERRIFGGKQVSEREYLHYMPEALRKAGFEVPEPPVIDNILQIKGKQNRAPNEAYLPYVQDFVKNGPASTPPIKYPLIPETQLTKKGKDGNFIDSLGRDVGNASDHGVAIEELTKALNEPITRKAGDSPDDFYESAAEYVTSKYGLLYKDSGSSTATNAGMFIGGEAYMPRAAAIYAVEQHLLKTGKKEATLAFDGDQFVVKKPSAKAWGEVGDLENTGLHPARGLSEDYNKLSAELFPEHTYLNKTELEQLREVANKRAWDRAYPLGSREGGAVDPKLLGTLALGGSAAALGAYLDSDKPLRGALLGALGVAGLGAFAKGQGTKGLDYALGLTSTRIGEISPPTLLRLRNYERVMTTRIDQALDQVDPFLRGLHKLPAAVKERLNEALLENDAGKIAAAIKGNTEMVDAWRKVQNLLSDYEAKQVGLGRFKQGLTDYFPRIVSDIDGLKEALGQTQRTHLEKTLADAEAKMVKEQQRGLTDVERSLIVNRSLQATGSSTPPP